MDNTVLIKLDQIIELLTALTNKKPKVKLIQPVRPLVHILYTVDNFIDSKAILDHKAITSSHDLYNAYVQFLVPQDIHPLTKKAFGIYLHKLGFEAYSNGKIRFRRGLRLKSEHETTNL